MKKRLITLVALPCALTALSAGSLSEDFATGLPSGRLVFAAGGKCYNLTGRHCGPIC